MPGLHEQLRVLSIADHSPASRKHLLDLVGTEENVRCVAGNVPKQALSRSVKQILKAKEILAVVLDKRSPGSEGMFRGRDQSHGTRFEFAPPSQATIYLDTNSASMLGLTLQTALQAASEATVT
jgi:hypothetical protein